MSGSLASSLKLLRLGEGDAEPYEGGGMGYWLMVRVRKDDPDGQ